MSGLWYATQAMSKNVEYITEKPTYLPCLDLWTPRATMSHTSSHLKKTAILPINMWYHFDSWWITTIWLPCSSEKLICVHQYLCYWIWVENVSCTVHLQQLQEHFWESHIPDYAWGSARFIDAIGKHWHPTNWYSEHSATAVESTASKRTKNFGGSVIVIKFASKLI